MKLAIFLATLILAFAARLAWSQPVQLPADENPPGVATEPRQPRESGETRHPRRDNDRFPMEWVGSYEDISTGQGLGIQFKARLKESDGTISGEFWGEDTSLWSGVPGLMRSDIRGHYSAETGKISFTKEYRDETSNRMFEHTAKFEGTYDPRSKKVRGMWKVSYWGARFEMVAK